MRYFLSHYQLRKIFFAYKLKLDKLKVSLDLGISEDTVVIQNDKVIFPDESRYDIGDIYNFSKDLRSIFLFEKGEIYKVEFFSEKNHKFYKLVSNGEYDYPNLEISGVKVYSGIIKDILQKRLEYCPGGRFVLIIGSKLGYSAIEFSKKYKNVIVLEEDENVIEISKYNPWSKLFFEKDNISYYICKPNVQVRFYDDKQFDVVYLDPLPFTKESRQYYSKLLYEEIFRVLNDYGIFLHCFSKSNRSLLSNIQKKLEKIGFRSIKIDNESECIIAKK